MPILRASRRAEPDISKQATPDTSARTAQDDTPPSPRGARRSGPAWGGLRDLRERQDRRPPRRRRASPEPGRPSELSAALAEAKRSALRLRATPRDGLAQEAARALVGGRPRPAALRQQTRPPAEQRRAVCSGGARLPAGDPLAGGLFSREANIDPAALRKGIYEAQLCRR
ncbi:unnamed protein product [Prorocentrum cordatum]|uniref:Uncharacterized protein n=1 Tax=Prorocentrum cordatum TaxID=2364126 RepID=A0ABN9S9D7_9DINO|nr:unnamed protein product [Polarella glacialis]